MNSERLCIIENWFMFQKIQFASSSILSLSVQYFKDNKDALDFIIG